MALAMQKDALVLIHLRGRSKKFPALLQDPKRCL